ncbi:transposase [Cohnella fermenti]|nr:transposase [Cohnella fermenti]
MMTRTATSWEDVRECYSSEEACAEALFAARWPKGFCCPACGHSYYYVTRTRRLPLYECKSCRHQASPTAGTVMEGSSTPLSKWFQAIFLLSQPGGISSVRLAEALEVTYKTAWLISHKIRQAMREAQQAEVLEGAVRIEAFGYGTSLLLQPNQPLLMGGSFDEEGELRHLKLQQPDPDHVKLWNRMIHKDGYEAFEAECVGQAAVTRGLYYSTSHRQLHPFRRQLNEWLRDTFCGIGAKHLQAYLHEFSFRVNGERAVRAADSLFFSLLGWCSSASRLTYAVLTRPRRTLPVAWQAYGTKGKWSSVRRRIYI